MFIFGTFIQLQMIFPLCLVPPPPPRCLRLHVNNNLGSSLPVIHTLHMKQEHNINMRNIPRCEIGKEGPKGEQTRRREMIILLAEWRNIGTTKVQALSIYLW